MTLEERYRELERRNRAAEAGGGEERIKRQHEAGKMTARELNLCDLAYAPPFASVWDAVQQAAGVIK